MDIMQKAHYNVKSTAGVSTSADSVLPPISLFLPEQKKKEKKNQNTENTNLGASTSSRTQNGF